ncbi:MAG: UbiA family prenyltransferase [Verrucomicrobiales bacterium]|nr:UbiA family prenyltransferase [Verrucomicrobiales bacterium]
MFPDWHRFGIRLRPWLILGRVSNLPTVWSNCLAAWLLGGGGTLGRLLLLLLGATLIYVGGMWLNDAVDAPFDREFRPERPIPAGAVSPADVWVGSAILLGVGAWLMSVWAGASGGWVMILVSTVVVYDVIHKRVRFAPVLMGGCRLALFLAAGSASIDGITGEIVWSAIVLGVFVVGLSFVARSESTGPSASPWALACLMLPVLLAGLVNPPSEWFQAPVGPTVFCFVLVILRSVSHLYRGHADSVRQTVGGLLAAIPWVDAVAVMAPPWPWAAAFVAAWALSILLQRSVPAT